MAAEKQGAATVVAGQSVSELIKEFEKDEKYRKSRADLIDILRTIRLPYHGLQHALFVEQNVLELAVAEGVPRKLLPILSLAALGHDTGFSVRYQNNEPEGARITTEIMKRHGYPRWSTDLAEVLIIHGTPFPQRPRTRLEKMMADSDLANLGTDGYIPLGMLLKEEWRGQGILKEELQHPLGWAKHQLAFIEVHVFFTTAARIKFNGKQEDNKEVLRREISCLESAERK